MMHPHVSLWQQKDQTRAPQRCQSRACPEVLCDGSQLTTCVPAWFVLDASAAGCVSPLDVESKTLQGVKGELDLDKSGQHHLENTTLDFQKLPDKEILRMAGPLGADFTVKVRPFPFNRWWRPRLIQNNERCFL